MFAAGDVVHYGMDGVCEVTGITEKKIGGQVQSYYELRPYFRKNIAVFLPVMNEQLLSRVRPVLSRDEVLTAIHEMDEADSIWIEPDSARKEAFQMIIRSGDHRQLVSLIKTLYERKLEMQEDGRKLRSADSAFLKDAERLINEEFAYVLGKQPGEIPDFIRAEKSKRSDVYRK